MPTEPQIQMLSYKNRSRFFKLLLLAFIILLPVFIFYTSGYRLAFEDDGATLVTTGGLYVSTNEQELAVFIDEQQVERPRLFRSAYYIQNIDTGQHRVVVQGDGVHTWVKELPVDAYIVTEAAAFNMPLEPQIRFITRYSTPDGASVLQASVGENPLRKATTTAPYIVATTSSETGWVLSGEYSFVDSLFNNTAASSTTGFFAGFGTTIERGELTDITTDELGATSTSLYPYVQKGDMRLVEKGDELLASWYGREEVVPYYFCVTGTASSTITERYGDHVAEQIKNTEEMLVDPVLINNNRFCREEIRIDRKQQEIQQYAFLPGSTDLVVLRLEDGVYVTEIDDRAWQNTQLVYPGTDFMMRVTEDAIYIEEDGIYFELITELDN